ncbi:hypothetical protein CTAYLR_008861 [Chrysophaeum taylorii]|uniref:Fructose-bisphosphate aldolase n=1 Tax=Chrysophaeum taylorii TaxID=2483200 RepID=A0AAD7XRT0_9STRA|nr:hypothetical protein CTAYLR_008861 [Chrysophaeum taylorii]
MLWWVVVVEGFVKPAEVRCSSVRVGYGPGTHGGAHLSVSEKARLEEIAARIATPGKGITACDEGPGTIGSRFEAVGVENTEENRRIYRQMLFETPDANAHLSAAILDPETIFQKNDEGVFFPDKLKGLGISPGCKPHLKVYTLPGTNGDTVMQGLDSLNVRLAHYAEGGCEFAKWRSPLEIDVAAGRPSRLAIEANMRDLARYALISQAEGLVPIVEPDVSLAGDHDLETALAINTAIQAELYHAMLEHGVYMEGTILKANMVNPGKGCPVDVSVEDIAEANLQLLRRCMPVAIRGVNYLSGGQSLEDAAARLSAINKAKQPTDPWNLSFSWSAALQFPLFDLCIGQGGQMPLEKMSALYAAELKIASDAAKGLYDWPGADDGAHLAPIQQQEPVAAGAR